MPTSSTGCLGIRRAALANSAAPSLSSKGQNDPWPRSLLLGQRSAKGINLGKMSRQFVGCSLELTFSLGGFSSSPGL